MGSTSAKTDAALNRKVQFWLQFCTYLVVIGWYGRLLLMSVPGTSAQPGWVQTPCTVESSELQGFSGESSNNNTRVEVVYRYAFDGREYKFSRPYYQQGSPGTGKEMNALLRRFPRGLETVCYVNPHHPAEAVLERPPTANSFLFRLGLVPLIAVVSSVIGLLFLWRRVWNQSGKQVSLSRGAKRAKVVMLPASRFRGRGLNVAAARSFELRPSISRLNSMLLAGFVALFWNGIVGVFLWAHFNGKIAESSSPNSMSEGGRFRFLMLFAFIGTLLMIWFIYSFLACFNPRPRLKINGRALALGDNLDLEWRIEGRVHQLKGLKLVLEGREETTYRRGTRTYTDVNVFARWIIAETTRRNEMRAGRASLVIPSLTVPTFETPNNKILWDIKVEGEIPHWPDLDEAMPLTLLPAQPSQTSLPTSASHE